MYLKDQLILYNIDLVKILQKKMAPKNFSIKIVLILYNKSNAEIWLAGV